MKQTSSQFERMLDTARTRLCGRDPDEIAARCAVKTAPGGLVVETLGQCVHVALPDCTLMPPLAKWHTLVVLHYLDQAEGLCPVERPMSFSQYPDGLVRGSGFDREAESVIRTQLGCLPPQELAQRCAAIDGVCCPSNADFCVKIPFLPRYPLWLRIWFADEEFPASGRLLLDETAPHQLSMEDAVTVGSIVLDRLCDTTLWTH